MDERHRPVCLDSQPHSRQKRLRPKSDFAPPAIVRLSPGLKHGILEVLAQEIRVAPGYGGPRLQLLLFYRLRHSHEKLRHLRQGQVDLHALVLCNTYM